MNKPETEKRLIPPFINPDESQPELIETPKIIDSDDYRTYGITKNDDRSLALKIIFKNGIIAVIPYNRVGAPIFYSGENKITVPVSNSSLEITGDNIAPLLDYLGHQKLVWMKEAFHEDEMMAEPGELLIKTVIYKHSLD